MMEKALQINKEKTAFWALLSVLILASIFYIYCINATVRNVVSRENFEKEAQAIALEISSKEFQYIGMKNALTLRSAMDLGFVENSNKTFIARQSKSVVSYAPRSN